MRFCTIISWKMGEYELDHSCHIKLKIAPLAVLCSSSTVCKCDYTTLYGKLCFVLSFRERRSKARAILDRSASWRRDADAHTGEDPEHVHTEDCKISRLLAMCTYASN